MTTTTLIHTGLVTHCCGDHITGPVGSCCDIDCGPCCPECVTCPTVQRQPAEVRRANAAQTRELHLALAAAFRDGNRDWHEFRHALDDDPPPHDPTPIYAGIVADLGIAPNTTGILWPDVDGDR